MLINAKPRRHVSNVSPVFESFVPNRRAGAKVMRPFEMTNNDVNAWNAYRPVAPPADFWEQLDGMNGNENCSAQNLYGSYFEAAPISAQQNLLNIPNPSYTAQQPTYEQAESDNMKCFPRQNPMLNNDCYQFSLNSRRQSFASFSNAQNMLKDPPTRTSLESEVSPYHLAVSSSESQSLYVTGPPSLLGEYSSYESQFASSNPQPNQDVNMSSSHETSCWPGFYNMTTGSKPGDDAFELPYQHDGLPRCNGGAFHKGYNEVFWNMGDTEERAWATQPIVSSTAPPDTLTFKPPSVCMSTSISSGGSSFGRSSRSRSPPKPLTYNCQSMLSSGSQLGSSSPETSSSNSPTVCVSSPRSSLPPETSTSRFPSFCTSSSGSPSRSFSGSSQGHMLAQSDTNYAKSTDEASEFSGSDYSDVVEPTPPRPRPLLPASMRVVPILPSNDFDRSSKRPRDSTSVDKPKDYMNKRTKSPTPIERTARGHNRNASFSTMHRRLEAKHQPQPPTMIQAEHHRKPKDDFLVKCKLAGMSYKQIRKAGKFIEAESTLRGRFRTLTKNKEARVRKPEWEDHDIRLLKRAVRNLISDSGKIPWGKVADYIADNGGSYHFGGATVHKRWDELQAEIQGERRGKLVAESQAESRADS